MAGRFAGEVAGVELRNGGVEVVEVEHDDHSDSLVSVQLDNLKDVDLNTFVVAPRP